MRNIYVITVLAICVAFGACKNNSNFYTDCTNITINAQVDSLLHVFMEENGKVECQYFLVTYLSCGQRIVTLIANNLGDNYYLRKQSLVYFIRNDRKIYLVTGVEDFLKKESGKITNKGNDETSPFSKIKSYVIERNKIEFIPKGIPPFAPPPAQPDK
jgi:hypothetical protein